MSTASAVESSPGIMAGRNYFLLRRLHSLTGLIFGGYIIVHLLVNATLIEGARHDGQPTVFQMQVDKIHSLPFLSAVEWIAIYLPLLFHTFYGIYIMVAGRPNVGSYPYPKNWFYLLQRISAIMIVFFLIFHVLGMKGVFGSATLTFVPEDATTSTIRHIQAHWTVAYLLYPIGVIASCFHLANGFWTAAITWGLTISASAQRRWGFVCAGLFLMTLTCGMLALIAVYRAGKIVAT